MSDWSQIAVIFGHSSSDKLPTLFNGKWNENQELMADTLKYLESIDNLLTVFTRYSKRVLRAEDQFEYDEEAQKFYADYLEVKENYKIGKSDETDAMHIFLKRNQTGTTLQHLDDVIKHCHLYHTTNMMYAWWEKVVYSKQNSKHVPVKQRIKNFFSMFKDEFPEEYSQMTHVDLIRKYFIFCVRAKLELDSPLYLELSPILNFDETEKDTIELINVALRALKADKIFDLDQAVPASDDALIRILINLLRVFSDIHPQVEVASIRLNAVCGYLTRTINAPAISEGASSSADPQSAKNEEKKESYQSELLRHLKKRMLVLISADQGRSKSNRAFKSKANDRIQYNLDELPILWDAVNSRLSPEKHADFLFSSMIQPLNNPKKVRDLISDISLSALLDGELTLNALASSNVPEENVQTLKDEWEKLSTALNWPYFNEVRGSELVKRSKSAIEFYNLSIPYLMISVRHIYRFRYLILSHSKIFVRGTDEKEVAVLKDRLIQDLMLQRHATLELQQEFELSAIESAKDLFLILIIR